MAEENNREWNYHTSAGIAMTSNSIKSPVDIPLETVNLVPVECLALDRRNPRLLGLNTDADEVEIIARLYRAEALSELLQSIASNGYLNIEPLVVLKDDGHLVVLEGNRRLAAIRLFQEPSLATCIFKREQLRITLPEITDEVRGTYKEIAVWRVHNRGDARSYIGFKHINGAAKWGSYAKAKFAAEWYHDGESSFSEIAGRIGDRHDTVKRMINAIYVLEQAEDAGVFQIDDCVNPRFNFSHLYTALSRAPYMQFLGVDASWVRFDPKKNPIPADKIDCLREVLRWIYGSKVDDVPPVVKSQNPDIKHLGEVIASTEGLTVLRARDSLFEAHASIQPADSKFLEALLRARKEIREASNSLRGFDGQNTSLIDIAGDIFEAAKTILGRMKEKAKEATKDGDE